MVGVSPAVIEDALTPFGVRICEAPITPQRIEEIAWSLALAKVGAVWLIIGTDSGYEGTTSLYVSEVDVTFDRVS